jgi:TRAP-type mannitol/chloroaromatic compound transport system permease small subunit
MQESYVWLYSFVFMLGAGYTLLDNGHVRVDIFYCPNSDEYKA